MTLTIYHTGDIHARRGFGERLASLVEADALLVDTGDSLAGSATIYRRTEAVIGELRRAPYRAQAVGNREFHYLHAKMLARARALPTPLVCSNLIDLRAREPAFARQLFLDVGDVRVRILGALAPQYRTGSGWERIFGWRFLEPGAALAELLASGDDGVDATVLLSHLGLAADRALAERFPALTAIIGGHSHDLLPQPVVEHGVPIVHAGAYAGYVGRLQLELAGGRATGWRYELLPLLATALRGEPGDAA